MSISVVDPISPSVLAVIVLTACLTCIWMVFFFGRRLQTSAYLRDSLIEGAKQQELKILLRELRDRAMEGPLDPRNPPPDGYGPTRRLWDPDNWGLVKPKSDYDDYFRRDETQEQKEERLRLKQEGKGEEERRLAAERNWELEERVRYDALRQQAEVEAAKRAEWKVPSSIDISLLGGGWSFLLEFSTVIVIIFTVLILSILKTLDGKDVS